MIADPGQLRVRRIRALTVMFCVAAAVLTADAISKALVLGLLPRRTPPTAIRGWWTAASAPREPAPMPSQDPRPAPADPPAKPTRTDLPASPCPISGRPRPALMVAFPEPHDQSC